MRRFAFALCAVLAVAVVATPAEAQLKAGAHVAMISGVTAGGVAGSSLDDLDGAFGFGGRIGVEAPLLPIGVYAMATYYLPDDAAGTDSYYTASLMAKLGLPLPIVQPYLLGGFQRRAGSVNDISSSDNGGFMGFGVQISKFFLEGAVEFNDIEGAPDALDSTPLVFKGGILIL